MSDQLQPPIRKHYYIGFNFIVDRQSIANLLSLVQGAQNLNALSVTICLTSEGGDPEQGNYAFQIIRASQTPIHTHAIGTIQSAAIPLFLAGQVRRATQASSFMLHEAVAAPGVQPLSDEHLRGRFDWVKHVDKSSISLVSERTGRPIEQVKLWFSGQKIRSPQFALDHGIAHSVEDLNIPLGADFVQTQYKF